MAKFKITATAFEEAYEDFEYRAEVVGNGIPFLDFDHPMVSPSESYKKVVYEAARQQLSTKFWKETDIGTGRIHSEVLAAIRIKVVHKGVRIENNLLNWRVKDDFNKVGNSRVMEQVLFDLYKQKRSEEECFNVLLTLDQQYQLIAYLFFLKDRDRFLPISQQAFDNAFATLGVVGFKTSGNASWVNFTVFVELNKQLQGLLQVKLDTEVELLDAHSFAWCIGYTFPRWDAAADEEEEDEDEEEGEEEVGEEDASPFDPSKLSKKDVAVEDEFTADQFPEGKKSYILHRKRERNAEVVRIAKARFRNRDPLMRCEVCSLSYAERYGELGIGYIEAHHTLPLSKMGAGHVTKPEDLAMVCSNCHVMLHRSRPWLSHDELKSLLRADGRTKR